MLGIIGVFFRTLKTIIFNENEDEHRIDQTLYSQIGLFTMEYSVATYLQSIGIKPQALLGHSVGEIAAATVSGVMSLEDGVLLLSARALLMSQAPKGAMAAVSASADQMIPRLATFNQGRALEDHVYLAADNHPRQVVISGQDSSLTQFMQEIAF